MEKIYLGLSFKCKTCTNKTKTKHRKEALRYRKSVYHGKIPQVSVRQVSRLVKLFLFLQLVNSAETQLMSYVAFILKSDKMILRLIWTNT